MYIKISISLFPICFYFVALISVFVISWGSKAVFNWFLGSWKCLVVYGVRGNMKDHQLVEKVIEWYCPEMAVAHSQKPQKWIYVLAKTEMIFISKESWWLEESRKESGWSSLGQLRREKPGLCLRYWGARNQTGLECKAGKQYVVPQFAKWKKKKKRRCYIRPLKSLNSLLITSPWQGFPISFVFFYVKYSWGFARQKLNTSFGAM